MEIKKCSNCKFSRGCPIYLEIRRTNRKSNLITYMLNEELEAYNDLYANICNLYKEWEKKEVENIIKKGIYNFDLNVVKKINNLIDELTIPITLKPFLCKGCGLVMNFTGHSCSVFRGHTPNYDTYYCYRCKITKTITY